MIEDEVIDNNEEPSDADVAVDAELSDDLPARAEVFDRYFPSREDDEPLGDPVPVAPEMLRKIIQAALLSAGMPLSVDKLSSLFDPERDILPEKADITAALEALASECDDDGFQLVEVGTGWRYQVRPETARWVNRLWEEKPQKYSRALLETLSLIAYRQPITRGDIEEIRGVAVSSHIIKTLTEREWIKVVGHRDVPGRPSLYATTRHFLDYFNLRSLDELPSLSEIADLDKIDPALNLALDDSNPDEPDTDAGEAAAPSAENAESVDAVDSSKEVETDNTVHAVESEDDRDIDADSAAAFIEAVAEPLESDSAPAESGEDVVEPENAEDDTVADHDDIEEGSPQADRPSLFDR